MHIFQEEYMLCQRLWPRFLWAELFIWGLIWIVSSLRGLATTISCTLLDKIVRHYLIWRLLKNTCEASFINELIPVVHREKMPIGDLPEVRNWLVRQGLVFRNLSELLNYYLLVCVFSLLGFMHMPARWPEIKLALSSNLSKGVFVFILLLESRGLEVAVLPVKSTH